MRLDILNPRLLPYAVTLGFLAAGAFLGLVVSTGKLVPIALVVGGAAGIVLLNALPAAVWILITGVLLISGPVGYFLPGLSKISWLFSLLGVFMSGAALLYSAAGRKTPPRPMPWFVMLALALAVLALGGTAFSNGSMAEMSAGLKRQFQFWGVIFLFAVYPFSSVTVRRWLVFLLGVALVQLPFAAYQRFKLMPQVMGFEAPGFVPFDIIVGTFEGSMFGGGSSAIMAMFQVIGCLGLYCAYREKLIGGIRCALLMLLVAAPLALGETKVVLLLIPVVLLAAFSDSISKRPLAFFGGTLLTVLLAGALGYMYFLVQVSGDMTLDENLADTLAYNFGEKGYYGTGVNRLTAVPYWFEQQSWAQPLRTLFGYGVGSAYGVDGRVTLPGHIFVAHAGMHIDLVSASQILWELGIVGALLFYGTIFGGLVTAKKNLAEAVSGWDITLCRLALGSLGASLLMSFYSASMVVLVTHSFLLALTLGLVAWRARQGPMEGALGRLGETAGGGPTRSPARARRFGNWTPPAQPGVGGFGGFGGVGGSGAFGGQSAGATGGMAAARSAFPGGAPRGSAAGSADSAKTARRDIPWSDSAGVRSDPADEAMFATDEGTDPPVGRRSPAATRTISRGSAEGGRIEPSIGSQDGGRSV